MPTRSSKTKRPSSRGRELTTEEREQKRREQRERVEKACRELLRSDGWRRWIRVRSTNGLSRYSVHNQFLLALQAMERDIELSYVTGFRSFKKLGRAVRKGERALWVLAPHTAVVKDGEQDRGIRTVLEHGARGRAGRVGDSQQDAVAAGVSRRVYFRAVPVFDASQTDLIPGAKVMPLTAPVQPLSGDSHEHLLEPLRAHATELGFRVEERQLEPNGPGGWCDYKSKLIVVGSDSSANHRVRVLVHELAHAHGISYKDYSRRQAEVLVDTATHIVLSNAGLDVSGETVPYISGWGESGALDAITEYAAKIDEVASLLEAAISPRSDAEAPTPEGGGGRLAFATV
jgi:hypothetical protein